MVKNLVQQGVEIVAELTERASVKLLVSKIGLLEKENEHLKKENAALRTSIVDTIYRLQDMTKRGQHDLEKMEDQLQKLP
jgi:uncharacterized protein YlxW (UPF0749 family)